MSKIKDKFRFFANLLGGIRSAIRCGNFIMYSARTVNSNSIFSEVEVLVSAYGSFYRKSLEAIIDKLKDTVSSESALSEARDILKQQ
jgi:hypothetical protein